MQLKIVNEEADYFHESVGISLDRANELSDSLDDIVKRNENKIIYTYNIMKEIAELCNSPEELVYCLINHFNYMAIRYGLVYCPPQNRFKFGNN